MLLFNSKIALNIHDAYQQKLGLDTNERTFKSLGLTGFMISDHVDELGRLFDSPMAKSPEDMLSLVEQYLSEDLNEIKNKNRDLILQNHTYLHRVRQLESL